jgi:hypothetical protein
MRPGSSWLSHPLGTVIVVGTANEGTGRWQVEQVLALAPRPTSVAAAQPLAVPARWSSAGYDERAVWGRCSGSSAEPYDIVVDHVGVAFRCTCPSHALPCKHALALLLLWARGQVPAGVPSGNAATWIAKRMLETAGGVTIAESGGAAPSGGAAAGADPEACPVGAPAGPLPEHPELSSGRDDRVARMAAGLGELDRWLDDRVRTGLADPALAQYAMWDGLAARLVDAQVGGLANRVRRLAGAVGASPDWHQQVLADSVSVALGWQVRQADVLAGVPVTDHWVVMGRSDTREDRIEVRRVWLRGRITLAWAMVLSFAAYRQTLDSSFEVGTEVHADLFRYPGTGMRVLVGPRQAAVPGTVDIRTTVAEACAAVGDAFVAEPWLERLPMSVRAAPAQADGRWVLTDRTGSLPLAGAPSGLGTLLACSAGAPVGLTGEWTPAGIVPLTVHLADRTIDIGPTADSSFVGAGSFAGAAS